MTPIEIKRILFATFAWTAPILYPLSQQKVSLWTLERKQTRRMEGTFAASVAHCNPVSFILAWTLFPVRPHLANPLADCVAHSCGFLLSYFGYPLTMLFSFAFIVGFVFG